MHYDLTPERILNILGDKLFPPNDLNELPKWPLRVDPLKWLEIDSRSTNVSLFYYAAREAPRNLLAALVLIFAIIKALEARPRPTLAERKERQLLRRALGQWLRYVSESSPLGDLSDFLSRLAALDPFSPTRRRPVDIDDVLNGPMPTPPRRSRLSFPKMPTDAIPPQDVEVNDLLKPVLFGPPPQMSSNCEAAEVFSKFQLLAQPVPRAPMPDSNTWREALTDKFPWASDMFTTLAGDLHLSKRTGQQFFSLPPILLIGRPGVGKTAMASAMAIAAGAPAHVFMASSYSDPVAFSGMPPSFKNASPSYALCRMLENPVGNPVFVIDEIDKVASSNSYGRLLDALLPLLERSTAARWTDVFLQQAADLSAATWILIANSDADLPRPFLSRCLRFAVPSPRGQCVDQVIRSILAEYFGAGPAPSLEPAVRDRLARDLDRHGDLRRIQRALRAALRHADWPLLH